MQTLISLLRVCVNPTPTQSPALSSHFEYYVALLRSSHTDTSIFRQHCLVQTLEGTLCVWMRYRQTAECDKTEVSDTLDFKPDLNVHQRLLVCLVKFQGFLSFQRHIKTSHTDTTAVEHEGEEKPCTIQ